MGGLLGSYGESERRSSGGKSGGEVAGNIGGYPLVGFSDEVLDGEVDG